MRRFATKCAVVFLLCAVCSSVRVFAADAGGEADDRDADIDRLRERIAGQDRRIEALGKELAVRERRAEEEGDPWGLRNDPNYLAPSGGGLLHSLFLRLDDELARLLDRPVPGCRGERPEFQEANPDFGDTEAARE